LKDAKTVARAARQANSSSRIAKLPPAAQQLVGKGRSRKKCTIAPSRDTAADNLKLAIGVLKRIGGKLPSKRIAVVFNFDALR